MARSYISGGVGHTETLGGGISTLRSGVLSYKNWDREFLLPRVVVRHVEYWTGLHEPISIYDLGKTS
jgi:hypothetical protein